MSKMVRLFTCICGVALLVGTIGCDDPNKKIATLEESNQSLSDQLAALQDELDACRSGNDACQRELAQARGMINDLSNRPPREIVVKEQVPVPTSVPEGWTAVPGGAMIAIEGEVLFDSGKAKLRPQARGVLQKVRDVITNQYAGKDIMVFGHTDDQPIKKSGWQDNYELSAERALAVVRWMKENGVNPSRLVACGAGEFRPRVANSSAKNRQQNRRVEIFALDAEVRTASR